MRKTGAFIIAAALMGAILTGCGIELAEDNVPEKSASAEATTETSESSAEEAVEYKTVQPPEGGWTTKEIMSVTYFCGHQLNYPLSINDLGDDFSLSNYSRLGVKKRIVPASLKYKGEKLANATVVKPHDETMIYNVVLTPELCKVTDAEPFVINGVKMYDSFEDVKAALGEDYYYSSDNSLMYNDRETRESLYSLFFENGKLVHINVAFRFDIDLPLYQRLKEQNNH